MTRQTVLYTHPMSRGRIVRWMLEEIGAPYETVIVDYGPSMKAPAYLSVNPMGKVPALVLDGAVVTETAAILATLADAHPAAGLAPPPDGPERGPWYRWLFFVAGPLEAATTNRALGFEIGDDPRRPGMAGYGSLDLVLDTIEGAIAGRDTLLDTGFTAADLYLAAHLGWSMRFGNVDPRAEFERYAALHMARPAARRAWQVDEALMGDHPMPA